MRAEAADNSRLSTFWRGAVGRGHADHHLDDATACYAWRANQTQAEPPAPSNQISNFLAVGQAVSPAIEFLRACFAWRLRVHCKITAWTEFALSAPENWTPTLRRPPG